MGTDKKPHDATPATDAKKKAGSKKSRLRRWAAPIAAATALTTAGVVEMRTSFIQSQVFSRVAAGTLFSTKRVTGPESAPPAAGPYDDRLGYTNTLRLRENLVNSGFTVRRENVWLDRNILGLSLYPIYDRKPQAGLNIVDETGASMYRFLQPGRAYHQFEQIPPIVAKSLLFVENRDLLANHAASHNPAIEWERMAYAMLGYGMKKAGLGSGERGAGGSTLATQIEKFRHSEGGITASPADKLRQMLSASVRSYQDGADTLQSRRAIVVEYLNSMPLAAYPRHGEINGLAEGMAMWFGRDFDQVNALLNKPESQLTAEEWRLKGQVYREALSLVMSVKKPSEYLLQDRAALEARVSAYLPLLAEVGVISPRLRAETAAARVVYTNPATFQRTYPPISKTATSLRASLLSATGAGTFYNLDRLDLTARTTLDTQVNAAVTATLRGLADPEVAAAAGITGYRLLNPAMTDQVIYSFTLYEKTPTANVLRVQTDNYPGQFNLNEGSKLELGSTAKLRTMVTYLECIAQLHEKYKNTPPEQLATLNVSPQDNLTRFVVGYFQDPATDKSLNGILEAALERRYSASPGESFYTGGGLHRFNNFDGKDNGRVLTVKESLYRSVNLPFIRMMRDIVNYHMTHSMNVDPAIFTDPAHPQRSAYLHQFADAEGQSFMWRFWREQQDKTPDQIAAHLASKTRRTPVQLAVVYRSLFPNASLEDMSAFIQRECTSSCKADGDYSKQYADYAKDKFNLHDRGYLSRLHPLELWVASAKVADAQLTWDKAVKDSAQDRIDVYQWLLRSNKMGGQNIRIRVMLEKEAFTHIHKMWQNMGFPFERMVPSYASALGSSGDTPQGLSNFVGILQNDGMVRPGIKFSGLDFGAGTPYSLQFDANPAASRSALNPLIAQKVRREMQGVVERGTARRAFESVRLSDGTALAVGGKTGTGDNRIKTRGGGTAAVNSRTATFVFSIDDRFYGTIVAYVPGQDAAQFRFTSALPVQIFKSIANDLQPLLDRSYAQRPRVLAVPAENVTFTPVAPASVNDPDEGTGEAPVQQTAPIPEDADETPETPETPAPQDRRHLIAVPEKKPAVRPGAPTTR